MNQPRLASIEYLRLLSILAVILIHTSTRNLELVHLNITLLPLTFFFNQAARFAVPLFFLISGYTCELKFNFNRFTKLLIPYLFWSFIYYYFIYTHHSNYFLATLLDGSSSYQLYFIPSLLFLYLLFPLLHRLPFPNLFLIVFGIINFYLLYLTYYLNPLPLYYPLSIAILNLFPFYFGLWAARNRLKILNFTKPLQFILILFLAYLIFFVYRQGLINYLHSYNFQAFYDQFRISTLLYTLTIFVLIFSTIQKSIPFLSVLSRLSFLVFFIHVALLEFFTPFFGHSALLLFLFVTFFSFLIAYLISKIPKLSLFTG